MGSVETKKGSEKKSSTILVQSERLGGSSGPVSGGFKKHTRE